MNRINTWECRTSSWRDWQNESINNNHTIAIQWPYNDDVTTTAAAITQDHCNGRCHCMYVALFWTCLQSAVNHVVCLELITIFRLCSTCPCLPWRPHVMSSRLEHHLMACLMIFMPGSVAGIKSKTGPEVSQFSYRTQVWREFRRSVRLWVRILAH